MEREIKFRGQAKNGTWFYGYLYKDKNKDTFIKWIGNEENIAYDNQVEVIPESVGEFTGLKDKNGKEIYEGDILRILERDWCSQSDNKLSSEEYMKSISSISQVIWSDGRFKLITIIQKTNHSEYVGDNSRRDIFEVIGNKFQNPELLK